MRSSRSAGIDSFYWLSSRRKSVSSLSRYFLKAETHTYMGWGEHNTHTHTAKRTKTDSPRVGRAAKHGIDRWGLCVSQNDRFKLLQQREAGYFSPSPSLEVPQVRFPTWHDRLFNITADVAPGPPCSPSAPTCFSALLAGILYPTHSSPGLFSLYNLTT